MWQPDEMTGEGWLRMAGEAFIRDLAVRADWDAYEQAGILDIRMAIADDRESAADRVFARAVVETPDGGFLTAGASRLVVQVPFAAPRTWCLVRLCRQILGPVFWSQGMPLCYGLLVILEDSHGQVLDAVAGKFGISGPAMGATGAFAAEKIPGCELLYA